MFDGINFYQCIFSLVPLREGKYPSYTPAAWYSTQVYLGGHGIYISVIFICEFEYTDNCDQRISTEIATVFEKITTANSNAEDQFIAAGVCNMPNSGMPLSIIVIIRLYSPTMYRFDGIIINSFTIPQFPGHGLLVR